MGGLLAGSVLTTIGVFVGYVVLGIWRRRWVKPTGLWIAVVMLIPVVVVTLMLEGTSSPAGDAELVKREASEMDAMVRLMAEEVFPGADVSGSPDWHFEEGAASITDFVNGRGRWRIAVADSFGTPEQNVAAMVEWWESNNPDHSTDAFFDNDNDVFLSRAYRSEHSGLVELGDRTQESYAEVSWYLRVAVRPWWLMPVLLLTLPVMAVAAGALSWAARRANGKSVETHHGPRCQA